MYNYLQEALFSAIFFFFWFAIIVMAIYGVGIFLYTNSLSIWKTFCPENQQGKKFLNFPLKWINLTIFALTVIFTVGHLYCFYQVRPLMVEFEQNAEFDDRINFDTVENIPTDYPTTRLTSRSSEEILEDRARIIKKSGFAPLNVTWSQHKSTGESVSTMFFGVFIPAPWTWKWSPPEKGPMD